MQPAEHLPLLAELFLDGRQADPPAERDMTEQLNGLQQEGQSRQRLSLQSTPDSTPAHTLPYQSPDHPDRHVGQEAMSFCSSAPAQMMSHLPAIRTSIPVPVLKQVSCLAVSSVNVLGLATTQPKVSTRSKTAILPAWQQFHSHLVSSSSEVSGSFRAPLNLSPALLTACMWCPQISLHIVLASFNAAHRLLIMSARSLPGHA